MNRSNLRKQYFCENLNIRRWTLQRGLIMIGDYLEEVVEHLTKILRVMDPEGPTHTYVDGSHIDPDLQSPVQMGKRRHSKKGRKWIANKYWHPRGRRKWVFCTKCRTLLSASDIKIVHHGMVRNKMNPYIDTEYCFQAKEQEE